MLNAPARTSSSCATGGDRGRDRGRAPEPLRPRARRRGRRFPRPAWPPSDCVEMQRWIGPFGLLAELTYRCPLACPYCSNPLDLADYGDELTTAEWRRVLAEAAALGVLQVHFSGGEPLLRRDLVELVAAAGEPRPLHQPHHQRARPLRAARGGAPSGRARPRADQHPGRRAARCPTGSPAPRPSTRKVEASSWSRSWASADAERRAAPAEHRPGRRGPASWPRSWGGPAGAGQHPVLRLGLAQPRRAAAQPRAGRAGRGPVVSAARERLDGPDGRHLRPPRLLQPLPQAVHGRLGAASAHRGAERRRPALPGRPDPCPLPRASVREDSLARIWTESPVFQRFRGTDWMPEPCRSCDRGARSTSAAAAARPSCSPATRPHRSGLPPVARPRDRGGSRAGGQ